MKLYDADTFNINDVHDLGEALPSTSGPSPTWCLRLGRSGTPASPASTSFLVTLEDIYVE